MSKTTVAYSVRCRSCIFANTISRRDMDIHLFCPFAGCIFTGEETHMHRLFGACISEKGGENGSKQR